MPKLFLSHNCVCQSQARVTTVTVLKHMWWISELKVPTQVKPNPMKNPCAGRDAAMLQTGKMTEATMTTKKSYFGPSYKNASLSSSATTTGEQLGWLVGVRMSLFPSHCPSHHL